MRPFVTATAIAAAYALLRGWPDLLPPLVRACCAVVAVALAFARGRPRTAPTGTPEAAPRRRVSRLDMLTFAFAVLTVEASFVAFLSLAPPPLESLAAGLVETVRPRPTPKPHAGDRRPSTAGNWLWERPGTRRLPRRADFRPGNRPEVFVRPADRADAALLLRSRIYLAAFALERYRDGEWSAATSTPVALAADAAGFIRFPERPGRPLTHEVFHPADPSGATPLVALQGPVAARLPALQQLGDGLRLLPPPDPAGIGHQYLAVSKPLLLDDLPANAAPPATMAAPDLLELPDTGGLAPRLRALAGLAAGTGTPRERLVNLRNHLRTTLDYSLRIDNPRDLDPLENFLFDEQRGPCELFATAGAMLARAAGVPARVAYGWSGGRYFEHANLFVFRTRDAHAWAEVWIAGHGWVVMDPTPPGAPGSPATSVAGPTEPVPGTDDPLATEETSAGPAEAAPGTVLALLAALALPAIAVATARAFTVRRRHAIDTATAPPATPTPDYLTAFRTATARNGRPLPPGRTLRQHIATLADQAPPFAAELVRYHYATRYESTPPDPAAERRLLRLIERWARR